MAPPSSSSASRVFAVEGITRSILLFLDLASFDAILHAFQATPELHGYLQDTSLWSELSTLHFKGQRDLELRFLTLPTRDRGWDWAARERTCVELQEFLQSKDERTQFDEAVTILEGDIGLINDIDGQPLDGIAFPTNSHLTNHYVGAAQAVFRRAGRGLTDHVNDPSFRGRRPTGSAVATPAFEAGVSKLIHCVGPRITMPDCFELLATTYENVMSAILHEELTCVTMASISTGNMGVPCTEGAQVALRTIQKFLRANHWTGKIAIVCYDEPVMKAFTNQKQALLKHFNEKLDLPALAQENLPRWPF
ncbi:Ganglioside-induced differentiation-associated protein 2 [Phytophthora pseudosyringae]|uniref:Ganglioside-induced differentiation-associated protein 2 n=1 Tax=Phytophthora pseudosyringae TaxID=221518 RepID=A0A8T1V9J1_9STRA|nr:Ganglioside-induced differentiation-associated protein 2 [Phytophthora pseudosyringae]